MKKKIIAMAALALLTLTGCVVYPYRPVVYAYPVDPNMPPPVVYVPSPDPYYEYPYAYGAPIFSFNWGGGHSVRNNYYGHQQRGDGHHGNIKR